MTSLDPNRACNSSQAHAPHVWRDGEPPASVPFVCPGVTPDRLLDLAARARQGRGTLRGWYAYHRKWHPQKPSWWVLRQAWRCWR